jgi:hypothetical protein
MQSVMPMRRINSDLDWCHAQTFFATRWSLNEQHKNDGTLIFLWKNSVKAHFSSSLLTAQKRNKPALQSKFLVRIQFLCKVTLCNGLRSFGILTF